MAKIKTPRPCCRNCGRPLRRYKYTVSKLGHDASEALRNKLGVDGKPAEWGDYGDNALCGMNCGYGLALSILKRRADIFNPQKWTEGK